MKISKIYVWLKILNLSRFLRQGLKKLFVVCFGSGYSIFGLLLTFCNLHKNTWFYTLKTILLDGMVNAFLKGP